MDAGQSVVWTNACDVFPRMSSRVGRGAGRLWFSWCVLGGGVNSSVFFFFDFSSNAHDLLQA